MSARVKNIIYSVVLLISVAVVYFYRKTNATYDPVKIEGATMGTTYHITYFDKKNRNFTSSVDSLLGVVNKSINTYDPESEVSMFNKASTSIKFHLPYLLPPIKVAREVFRKSSGSFDLTVMPLVNAWGFGPGKVLKIDSAKVDSIRMFVGLDKVQFNEDSIWKTDPRVQLDFGGIGQGYGADVITSFLKSKGVKNMMVELGGEGMACGINLKSGEPWKIGILDPNSTPENQFFKATISLRDRSFTTSGNYFNYRIVDGKKFSHTIDPSTGYPAQRAILSASVFAKDCTIADAWGTALMVMGHEKAIELLKSQNEIDALLMYSDHDGSVKTYATPGIEPLLNYNP
ncbi:MAG TPA: FAD:protein FMN transferase [Cyclobacteriaceae bacterium]|nr:FAD:protein FMN transferase [Cyclobacteriaceae bacterium]